MPDRLSRGRVAGCWGEFSSIVFSAVAVAIVAVWGETAVAQTVAAGSTETGQAVSPSGSPVSRIAIPLPPGAGGLEPTLFFQYSGQTENIGLGPGWSIGGYPRIARGNKSWVTDKQVGGVHLANDDAFYLDGDRLIPVSSQTAGGVTTVEFRKELDDASRILGQYSGSGSFQQFTLESKAGLTTVFSPGPSITVSGASAPIVYLPSRTSDRTGNYIDWVFTIDGLDVNLSKVLYTGFQSASVSYPPLAEVDLDYQVVPRAATSYVLGQPLARAKRLTSARIELHGALAPSGPSSPRVDLGYRDVDTSERFFLTSVRYTGYGGLNLQPVILDYRPSAQEWTKTPALSIPVVLSGGPAGALAYQFAVIADASGKKVTALLVSFDSPGGRVAKTYAASGSGWVDFASKAPPVPFVDASGRSLGVHLMDVNGDGLTDIVQNDPRSGIARAFLQTDKGWIENDTFAPTVPLANADGSVMDVREVDLDGDKRTDLLIGASDGTVKALLNRLGGWVESSVHEFKDAAFGETLTLDADCDGFADLVRLVVSGNQLSISIRKSSASGWSAESVIWSANADAAPNARIWSVQISGEICRGLLVNYLRSGQEQYAAQIPTTAAWTELPVRLPKSIVRATGGSIALPRFADLNGDGADEVLVNTGPAGDAFTLIQTSRSNHTDPVVWTMAAPEYAPPVALQVGTSTDVTVVLTDVDGNGKTDVAALPGGARTVGNVYLSNGSQWQAAYDLAPPTRLAQDQGSQGFLRFVDLDGDGLVDIIFNRGGSDADAKGAWRNTGAGWVDASSWAPPRPLQRVGDVDSPGILQDVDGDGLADLIYAYVDAAGQLVLETYLNRSPQGATSWGSPVTAWALPKPLAAVSGGDLGGRLVDLNGDGLIDVIYSFEDSSGNLITQAYLNTGSGWAPTNDFKSVVPFAIAHGPFQTRNIVTNVQLLDINGDRLPDLVAGFTNPLNGSVTNGVYLNDGTKFQTTPIAQVPALLDTGNQGGPNVIFQDLNADGVVDLIVTTPTTAQVYLGTGAGWTRAPGWDLPDDARSDLFGFDAVRIIDVTGDGHPDLLFHAPQRDGSFKKGAYINTGQGWQKAADTLAPPDPLVAADGSDSGVRPIDVNGDNAPDLVRSVKAPDGTLNRSVALNPNSRSGMLASVSNNGVTTTYEYAAMTEPHSSASKTYTPGVRTAYPIISAVPARPLVVEVTVDEGGGRSRGTSFAYAGFKYDQLNAISLGFASIDRRETPSRVRFHTEYHQDYGLIGLVRLVQVFAPGAGGNDVPIITEAKTWSVSSVPGQALGGVPHRYLQAQLTAQMSERRDLNGALIGSDKNSFLYDEWMNGIQTTSVNVDGATQRIDNDYGPPGENRRLGRLLSAVSQHSRPGVASETRTAAFTYAPGTLLLETETSLVGHAAFSTRKTYNRDPRGNVTSTIISGQGLQSRVDKVEYDDLGRMITATINAANHRSIRTADPNTLAAALALPGHITDPNGLTTEVAYDGLGRIAQKTGADGVTVSFERYLSNTIPSEWLVLSDHARATHATSCRGQALPDRGWIQPIAQSAEAVWVTASSQPKRFESATIYDPAGRIIRQVSRRSDGRLVRYVFQDYEYDNLGRLIGRSRPYFSGNRSYWTDLTYDVLDRRVREVRSDGACLDFKFDGLTETRIDALGQPATVTMNATGKPIAVKRPAGGTTTYTYDVMDRLTTITTPDGALRTYAYDVAGNRIHTGDPNAGETDFVFDAFGQLRKQKAKSALTWTEIEYDVLGRPTRKWQPDRVSTWKYDAASALGLMQSASSTTQNVPETHNYTQSFEYDNVGRLYRATVAYDGAPGAPVYTGSYVMSYDEEGRLLQRVYPGSNAHRDYATTNQYNPDTGQLVAVTDTRGGGPVWRLITADATGRVTRVQLGNGAQEIRSRDPLTGDVTATSVIMGRNILLAARYKYDAMDNLTSRSDAVDRTTENFTYDANDRLVRVAQGNDVIRVSYDMSGRITQKSDVGTYSYGCANGPLEGVCGIANGPMGTKTLAYDDRGNVILTAEYQAEYTSDNRVSRLNRVTAQGPAPLLYSQFEYGPDGSRIFTRERGCDHDCIDYRVKETLHMGMTDRITVRFGPSKIVTDRYYVEAGDGAFLTVDAIDRSAAQGPSASGAAERVAYLHRDHLGSIALLTSATGAVLRRFKFDPWGSPHGLSPEDDWWGGGAASAWTRGFSGHDHIPQFPLIHMNGRVYDPRLSEFLSVDPEISDSGNDADLNGYTYARNNPLTLRDISGFDIFGDIGNFFSNAGSAIASAVASAATSVWHGVTSFVERNWREIVTVAVVIVVAAATEGAGVGPVLAGMAAGAAGGATGAALHGGTFSDVMAGAIIGADFGAFGGAIGASALTPAEKVVGYGLLSGGRTQMSGGDFGRGFLAGALMAGADSKDLIGGKTYWATAGRVAVSAAVNGTVAELYHDKFANGAMSGAFYALWRDARDNHWTTIETVSRYVGMYEAREANLIGLGAATLLYGYSSLFADSRWKLKYDNGVWMMEGVPSKGEGLTLGNVIFYTRGDGSDVLQHELTHVPQWGAYGSQGFWNNYTRQTSTFGYYRAPFEAEAYCYGDNHATCSGSGQ